MGRVLHFLNKYVSFDCAEMATVGWNGWIGYVVYRGKRLATFTWSTRFGEADVPEFKWLDDPGHRYNDAQNARREEALMFDRRGGPEKSTVVDELILKIVIRDAWQHAKLYAEIMGAPRAFSHDGERLWLQAGDAWFYYDADIRDWLRS